MLTVRPIAGLYAAVPLAFLVVVEGGRAFRAWSGGEGRWQGRARVALSALVPAVVAGLLFLAGSLLGRLPQLIFANSINVQTPQSLELAWGAALVLVAIVLLLNLVARVIAARVRPLEGR